MKAEGTVATETTTPTSKGNPTLELARSRVSGVLMGAVFMIGAKPPGSGSPEMVSEAAALLIGYGLGGSGGNVAASSTPKKIAEFDGCPSLKDKALQKEQEAAHGHSHGTTDAIGSSKTKTAANGLGQTTQSKTPVNAA